MLKAWKRVWVILVGWGLFKGGKVIGGTRCEFILRSLHFALCIDEWSSFESELVKQLRSLGATLYCKTSLAHADMSGDTANNIIGTTVHPRHRLLHPGASSGGEGALVGCKASPLGIGTNMGGSVRNLAVLNGLFGLRPSAGRLSYEGSCVLNADKIGEC